MSFEWCIISVSWEYDMRDVSESLLGYPSFKKWMLEFLSNNEWIKSKNKNTFKFSDFNFNKSWIKNIERKWEMLQAIISSLVPKESRGNKNLFSSNENSFTIDLSWITVWGENITLSSIFSSYEYKWESNTHVPYMDAINAASAQTGVPTWAIIQLIYHENRGWNPGIKNPWSSAYGLGQMIDSTWNTYWAGLNRHDPADQLLATARYMASIRKNRGNCPWEMVLAYYNTWEGIWKLTPSQISNYSSLNSVIVSGRWWHTNDKKQYFIAAVAYYNDLNGAEGLEQARKIVAAHWTI